MSQNRKVWRPHSQSHWASNGVVQLVWWLVKGRVLLHSVFPTDPDSKGIACEQWKDQKHFEAWQTHHHPAQPHLANFNRRTMDQSRGWVEEFGVGWLCQEEQCSGCISHLKWNQRHYIRYGNSPFEFVEELNSWNREVDKGSNLVDSSDYKDSECAWRGNSSHHHQAFWTITIQKPLWLEAQGH